MSTTTPEPPPDLVATPAEVRAKLLHVSGRGYTVVRHILNQHPSTAVQRVSVLGPMVTDRKRRALQLYLLLLTVWPWLHKQAKPLPNKVWANALTTEKGRMWSPTNVSEAWNDLEERGLITRQRLPRGVLITPRREDGQAAYTPPGGRKGDHRESYFVLPGRFWTDGLFERLSLPGLAMLLIIAGLTSGKDDEVWLTNKDAAEWFGLSPRSVESGIEDLRDLGLLNERVEWIKSPLSAIGATKRHWYSLTGEFATDARRALQERTRKEVRARTRPSPRRKRHGSTTKAKKNPRARATRGDKATRRRKEESR